MVLGALPLDPAQVFQTRHVAHLERVIVVPAPRVLVGPAPRLGHEVGAEDCSEAIFEDGPVDSPVFENCLEAGAPHREVLSGNEISLKRSLFSEVISSRELMLLA